MKRDMELVRTILIQVEEKGKPQGTIDLDITEHSEQDVTYHVMLLHEAGLLEATNFSTMHGAAWGPRRLTWAGHEFLDAVRNATVWNHVKETVKAKGSSIPFEVLKALALKAASSFFGLS